MSRSRVLRIAGFLAVIVTPALSARSQQPTFHGRRGEVSATVTALDDSARIDGVLDDAAWSRATLLTGFSSYLPLDGRPADDSTEVYIWYSASDVYIGVRAFEPHGAVHATLAARDRIDQDDYIQILLDPFNDRRRAFIVGVNPLGAQADGVRTEGFSPPQPRGSTFGGSPPAFVDLNPDFLFESKGRVTDIGYEIEIRLPLKSIRFQGENSRRGQCKSCVSCSIQDTSKPGRRRGVVRRRSWCSPVRCAACAISAATLLLSSIPNSPAPRAGLASEANGSTRPRLTREATSVGALFRISRSMRPPALISPRSRRTRPRCRATPASRSSSPNAGRSSSMEANSSMHQTT